MPFNPNPLNVHAIPIFISSYLFCTSELTFEIFRCHSIQLQDISKAQQPLVRIFMLNEHTQFLLCQDQAKSLPEINLAHGIKILSS